MNNGTNQLKTSLKNNIVMAFFIVLVMGGVTINLILHSVIHSTLVREGLKSSVISDICRYFTIIGSGITTAGIIIILFIAMYISESITRPLKTLTESLMDIAKGKWDTRIEITSQDEIGQLTKGFNFMADSIERALQNIKAAKDYTDNIIISVPSILIVLNEKLDILSTNMAFEKLSEQFPALSLKHFINPLKDEIRKNLETGLIIKKEITIVPEDSKTSLYFAATISSIGHEDGDDMESNARVLLTITDITEQKKMKELVMQSKQDWEDTFNTIPDIITIHDKDYNIIYANKAARDTLNIPLLDIDNMSKCYRHYHGTDNPPESCPSCSCLHTKMPVTFEIYEPYLKKFIEIRSIPRLDMNNQLIGLIHIVRDISERKQIEQEHNKLLFAVTKAKKEWEMTFDSVKELIVLIDNDLKITRCNRSFSEYAGLPAEKLIGSACYEFFSCTRDEATHMIDITKKSPGLITQKAVRTDKGRWLYMSYRPIMDENNNFIFSVVIATDITELKTAQKKLNESEEELKKRVNELEKFYNMSVGRELRMKELKKEIKKLSATLYKYEEDNLVKG